jgi:hypothetical protein
VYDPLVRVLDVVFWIIAAMLVGALFFLDEPAVNAVLMALLVVCSGVLALYEFRLNPLSDTERGEWTGRQLFYALVFAIGFSWLSYISSQSSSSPHLRNLAHERRACRRQLPYSLECVKGKFYELRLNGVLRS